MKNRSGALTALFIIFVGYVLLFAAVNALPFLDFPNHVARVVIISELLRVPESPYHQVFSFNFRFSPYILPDLLMLITEPFMGARALGALWISIAMALLPMSVFALARVRNASLTAAALVALLCFFVTTNWFLMSGFFAYSLGFSFSIMSVVAFELMIRACGGSGLRAVQFINFAILVAATYLTHLAPFLFLCVIVAALSAFRICKRALTIGAASIALTPAVLIGLLHCYRVFSAPASPGETVFRSPLNKVAAIGSMFVRYDYLTDTLLVFAFVGILLVMAMVVLKDASGKHSLRIQTYEECVVAGIMFFVYLLLPVSNSEAHDVDNRALPYVCIFAILPLCREAFRVGPASQATVHRLSYLVLGLAFANFLYLAVFLSQQNERAEEIFSKMNEIPKGAFVFPVVTTPDVGRVQSFLHISSMMSVFRRAYTPYVFDSTQGYPQKHFTFKDKRYTPSIFWASRGLDVVDWRRVRKDYDYVFIVGYRETLLVRSSESDAVLMGLIEKSRKRQVDFPLLEQFGAILKGFTR